MSANNDTAANWLSRAARDEASAARRRATAAQQWASDAKRRVRSAARNGAVWKILRFFENRTPAAWGALWYLLLSIIGVTYSWAFYSRFEGVHIFDFFGTSDFLLSAFQNVEMLVIGISATLIGIGILIYRAYDSIVYSAYKSDPKEKKAQIRREAIISLSIALTLIVVPLYHYFCYFSVPLSRISTDALAHFLPLPFLLPFYSLLSPLPFLTYRFFGRIHKPGEDKQRAQTNWETGILLFLLLAEATFILPSLHGRSDSKAALTDQERRAWIMLRQAGASLDILPSDRILLFLGTTSSFHFFYYEECGEALGAGIDPRCKEAPENKAAQDQDKTQECKKGRLIIIPTANIASLEFNPKDVDAKPRVGLSDVTDAITKLDTTIRNLKFNAIFRMESGDVIFDTTKTAEAVMALDETVRNSKPVTVPNPNQVINAINTNTERITTAIKDIKFPPEVRNHCVSGWKKVATIGPFREGHDALGTNGEENRNENGNEPPCELDTPNESVNDSCFPFEAKTLQQLMLIGRVDVTPLNKKRRGRYGSNNGLAQSRAKWVRDELVKELKSKWGLDEPEERALLERTILLSAGPLHVDTNDKKFVPEEERKLDRSVEVWVCGGAET